MPLEMLHNPALHRTVSVCALNDCRVSFAHRETWRRYRRLANRYVKRKTKGVFFWVCQMF